MFERELAISEETMGPDHPQTAESLVNVANTLWYQGLYPEAQSYLERAVEINVEALGEHPATAGTVDNLASVLVAQETYEGARPFREYALAIRQKILGDDHLDTAISMNNLAHLLQSMGMASRNSSLLAEALTVSTASVSYI